jgi:hypothetical protein
MGCVTVNRLTSKDLRVDFIPACAEGNHDQSWYVLHQTTYGGTFKISVNGRKTAAITYNATPATLKTNIESALDTLLGATVSFTATVTAGTSLDTIQLVSDIHDFYKVSFTDWAVTDGTDAIAAPTTAITTQGSVQFTLSAAISQFSYEVSVDTIDVTAISEYQTVERPVKESMTFDFTAYDANETWQRAVYAGQEGKLIVYKEGLVAGKEMFSFVALLNKAGTDFPDHEKIEISFSGVRVGAMIDDFGTIVTA